MSFNKHYIPSKELFSAISLLDEDTLKKVKSLIDVIDVKKLQILMNAIDGDGNINLKVKL